MGSKNAIAVLKKPLALVVVSASLAGPAAYGVYWLIPRTVESILTAAARSRGANRSFMRDVVSHAAREDPPLAVNALRELEQIHQASATQVFVTLPADLQQAVTNVPSYHSLQISSESTRRSVDELVARLPPYERSELFKDQSSFLRASKQAILSDALEKADLTIYTVDGALLDKNAKVWKQVAAEFRKQARAILQEALDDVPAFRRDTANLKDDIRNGLDTVGKNRKYRFEFDVASGKLKIPNAIEVLGGKVYFGDINVYHVVAGIGALIYAIEESTGGERDRERQDDKENPK